MTNYQTPNEPPFAAPIGSAFAHRAKDVYNAATALWFSSNVERHAEGHPGAPGPGGDPSAPWDENRAYIEGAITALTLILERLYMPNPKISSDPSAASHGSEPSVD